MLRSILGVVGGYLVWTVLWLGGGLAMMPMFPDQPTEAGAYDSSVYLALSLVLSVVCSLAAGAVCARISRSATRTPAIVLSVLLLLTGLGVQIGAWSMMPVWYHLPFLVLLVPVTLLGASLVKPKRA